MSIEKNN